MLVKFFCNRYDPQAQFRLAIGSYVERYSNSIQIVKKRPSDQDDINMKASTDASFRSLSSQQDSQMYKACEFDHPYPCTKVLWNPDISASGRDLVATTGDYLRLWNLEDDGSGLGTMSAKKEVMLNSVSVVYNTFALLLFKLCFNESLIFHNSSPSYCE